ncbi:MAG: sodium ion-translocating decarboxylase subunit beta [Chitinispirillales bacterium]|jgi:oxaloacetate decarboxylase beta subunit|nr:sodium ion-translocating decarboxylase subunit beta [Chitinispirillales bacterium]
MDILFQNIFGFLKSTGVYGLTSGHLVMMTIGIIFIYLGISKNYEPLLLVPIGFGIILGNIPITPGMQLGVYDTGVVANGANQAYGDQNIFLNNNASVFSYFYYAVRNGIFPPLIFFGIGALTDFSTMLSNPKLILLGGAAQFGIFATLIGALALGFTPQEAGSIGIIGGADGPTSIFLCSNLAPHLIGPVAIAAYSYMALVPVIQPPVMRLLTTKKERLIRMKPSRPVSKRERIIFPIIVFLVCAIIVPGSLVLVGMLMFGNLLKESGVTERLAETARNAVLDTCTALLGISVGASTAAHVFLKPQSVEIFALGAFSFIFATASGVIGAKLMNLFLKDGDKINPLIGAAGVSAVPDSARVVQHEGHKEDKNNHLLMHAMAPNVAGVIGSAIAAGYLWSILAM